MRKQVTYETADGSTATVTRDTTHLEQEPLLTAHNTGGGVDTVQIPLRRVVRVDTVDEDRHGPNVTQSH